MHQHPAAAVAAFAGIEIHAEHHRVDHGVPVAIGKDDLRILAAQFQRHFFEALRGDAAQQAADPGRSRERQHGDRGMLGQRLTDSRSLARDEVDHARRHARLRQDLHQDGGGAGRQFAGLDDAGAAGGQRERQLLRQYPDREIPWRDQAHHADGLAQHDAQHVLAQAVVGVAAEGARQAGRVLPQVDAAAHFAARLGQRLARFQRFEQRHLVDARRDAIGHRQQDARALHAFQAGPAAVVKRPLGGADRFLDVSAARFGKGADQMAMGRAAPLEARAVKRLAPGAVDIQLAVEDGVIRLRCAGQQCRRGWQGLVMGALVHLIVPCSVPCGVRENWPCPLGRRWWWPTARRPSLPGWRRRRGRRRR